MRRLGGLLALFALWSAPATALALEVVVTHEDEYFPPPRELRELLAALDAVASVTLGAPPPARSGVAQDRQQAASDVLDALAAG